jgi:glycosyltransferase involved in cell wall biosynthesis
MRILVLNYEYPPLGGGAGVATAALARGLVARGVDVDVVTAGADLGERRAEPRDAAAEKDGASTMLPGLQLYRVPSRRVGVHEAGMVGAATYLASAYPVVRRLLRTNRYDLLHVFFSLPTGALLPLLDLRGTAVVVSLRGSDVPGYDPYNATIRRVHWLLAPLTRWIWRRADRVVAVCESLGRLTADTCPGLPYTVIQNGVDLTLFHPAEAPRARNGRVRCLAVARLVERKGLGDLIRGFSRLPRGRYELEVVGDGPDEAMLRGLARDLGLQDEIHFLGSLGRAEVAQRYREADLFTLPSSAEAFGNVFAEALASGLPIVGSTVGGIPELVEHGTNGLLVSPGSPAAVAQAIEYLAEDPQLCRSMAARNRARAEKTLEWSQVVSRYLSVYQAVLHPEHAPAAAVAAATPT